MRSVHHKYAILIAFFSCLTVGTLGYYLIEGWPLLESLYMTVITITTVGFHEENPLSPEGKIFTIFLIFIGFGICVYTLSTVTQIVLRGELVNWFRRYLMDAKIGIFKNHYIVCGYGRMGKEVVSQLTNKGLNFVIVEANPAIIPDSETLPYPLIFGSSSDEETLKQAGIEHAACLISVVSTDAENAFTVMTARRLNSKLHIVCRCFENGSISKIKAAGANQVVTPYALSSNRITQAAIHPTMVEFVEFIEDVEEASIEMADLEVKDSSALVGKKLSGQELNQVDVMVVGIKKAKGGFTFHPRGDTIIDGNDHLVVVGKRDQVESLADISLGR